MRQPDGNRLTPMLRELWNRITGRIRADETERELERERGNPEERRLASEPFEDYQADNSIQEHLGGVRPESLIEDDRPPR